MSILIKGMAMPKNCGDCPLFESKYHYHGCHAKPESFSLMNMWDFVGERPPWCPLIELPPHGRLIDADALTGELQTTNGDENNGAKLLLDVFLEVLKSAPTIIEADNTQNMRDESEEEDG